MYVCFSFSKTNKKENEKKREIQSNAIATIISKPSASFMKAHWKHITQSRKCNLVIKKDAYFSMRGPLSEAAAYGFS